METGVRAIIILEAFYPTSLDLQRLVEFDYLVVHSGDAGGPESLHAPLPLRTGELLVRRSLIESGLNLMMSRSLVQRLTTTSGIQYLASENASPFLSALTTPYISKLKQRGAWVAEQFGGATDKQLRGLSRRLFNNWTTQFQPVEHKLGSAA